MSDFSKNIQDFTRYGTYTYKFDATGNLSFDSGSSDFSRVYLAFPLRNVVYNTNKIEAFYDIEFEEFGTSTAPVNSNIDEESQIQVNNLEEENASLKTQLEILTTQIDNSDNAANAMAIKRVIIELRSALGQGRVDSDFSDEFPYSPIAKNANITSNTERTRPT